MLCAASFLCASAAAFGLTVHPAAPPAMHSLLVARMPRARAPTATAVDANGVTEPLLLSELPIDPAPMRSIRRYLSPISVPIRGSAPALPQRAHPAPASETAAPHLSQTDMQTKSQ